LAGANVLNGRQVFTINETCQNGGVLSECSLSPDSFQRQILHLENHTVASYSFGSRLGTGEDRMTAGSAEEHV
jgi:hypothetical protein